MSLLLVKCFLSLVFLTMTLLSICYQLTVHSYSQKKRKTNLPGSLVYEFLPFLFYATLKNLRQLNMSHWALKNSDWRFSYIFWTSNICQKKKDSMLICWVAAQFAKNKSSVCCLPAGGNVNQGGRRSLHWLKLRWRFVTEKQNWETKSKHIISTVFQEKKQIKYDLLSWWPTNTPAPWSQHAEVFNLMW